MNIKKLDKRSKLFNFGFTYKLVGDSGYAISKHIDGLLQQIAGHDKFRFVNMSETLNEMYKWRHRSLYDYDVLYHYDRTYTSKVYYMRNESTLAMLKMAM